MNGSAKETWMCKFFDSLVSIAKYTKITSRGKGRKATLTEVVSTYIWFAEKEFCFELRNNLLRTCQYAKGIVFNPR